MHKTFYELLVMANEAEEGSNLGVSLQCSAYSAMAFRFVSLGLTSCLDTSWARSVYLLFEEAALQWFQF